MRSSRGMLRKVFNKSPPGYSSEASGLAERHNRTLLDLAMPMRADSADASFGLLPQSTQHAADAIIYANDLQTATPSASAMVGATPHEGLLKRAVTLSVFLKFGCRVWNHSPGRPYAHRQKTVVRLAALLVLSAPTSCACSSIMAS